MGLFRCKICDEKEKRIAELKDEIKFLRSLQDTGNDVFNESPVVREAGAILDNRGEVLLAEASNEEQQEELEKFESALSERDRIISGNY